MKCETKQEAQRVAYFGMLKMQREGGYTREATTLPGGFLVRKDDGGVYGVAVEVKHAGCTCPFYAENREFGICKHIYWVREELNQEANFQSLGETLEVLGSRV